MNNKITNEPTFMFLTHAKNYANDLGISIENLMDYLKPKYDIPSYLKKIKEEWDSIVAIEPDPKDIRRVE